MGDTDDSTPLRFQGFELHPDTLELRHHGRLVDLAPSPTRALLHLARHAGRLVRREELYDLLWPEGGVDVDRGLNTYVRRIRRALGERSGENRFIRTHPGRGYRFVARMEQGELEDGGPGTGPRDDGPVSFLRQGSAARRLTVAAAAAMGGVVLVLLASSVFDDRSAFEDGRGPVEGALTEVPPLDSARRIAYLTGLELLGQALPSRRARAAEHFRLVTAARPDFGPAYAGLAESLIWAGDLQEAGAVARAARALAPDDPRTYRALGTALLATEWDWGGAEEHLRNAVALDPADAESHVALAYLLVSARRVQEARLSLDRAAALEPVSPLVIGDIGTLYRWIGHDRKALELCRRALDVEPEATWARSCVERGEMSLGIATEAQTAGAVSSPDVSALPTHLAGAMALVRAGRPEEAVDALERSARARELGFVAIGAMPELEPLRERERFRRLLERLFAKG